MKRIKDKENYIISRSFYGSMGAMIATNIAAFAGSIIDGIIISRMLGGDSMSAFQLALPVYLIAVLIGVMFATGLQKRCSYCIGSGDKNEACSSFTITMIALAAISAVFMALICLFKNGIVSTLGAPENLASEVGGYLLGIVPAIPALILMMVLSNMIYLTGSKKYVIMGAAAQTVIDIIGDLLNALVFKKGLFGMGLATSASYIAAAVIVIVGYRLGKSPIGFKLSSVKKKSFGAVVKAGLPLAVEQLYNSAQIFILNRILLAYGDSLSVNVYSILNTINNLMIPFNMGIGMTAFMMAGVFYGERDRESLSRLMKTAYRSCVAIETLVVAVVVVASPLITMMFVSPGQADVYNATVAALRIYAVYIPFYGLLYLFQQYFYATERFLVKYVVSIFTNLISICAVAWLLAKRFGANGVWWSFTVSRIAVILAVLAAVFIVLGKRIKEKDAFLFLPNGFDVGEDRRFNYTVTEPKAISELCAKAEAFCGKHHMNEKRKKHLSLILEESCGNILRWGEGRDKAIDVKIIYDNGWTIRIRDNCKQFDPKHWFELYGKDSGTDALGLKIINGLADKIEYSNIIGLNYLKIFINE